MGYKRPSYLAVLVSAHILLAPVWVSLWLVVPFAIWLEDRGPVFYSQKRIGKDGRVFTIRKFRSMVPDAEKHTGAVWAGKGDPRITRVGKALRFTALDELPQVVSIWKGDMSLVGPRAERPELHQAFASQLPEFALRLQAQPGLTGMAQVYGHYDSPPQEKLRCDPLYIKSASLWLDIKRIARSVFNTLLARWDRPRTKP